MSPQPQFFLWKSKLWHLVLFSIRIQMFLIITLFTVVSFIMDIKIIYIKTKLLCIPVDCSSLSTGYWFVHKVCFTTLLYSQLFSVYCPISSEFLVYWRKFAIFFFLSLLIKESLFLVVCVSVYSLITQLNPLISYSCMYRPLRRKLILKLQLTF